MFLPRPGEGQASAGGRATDRLRVRKSSHPNPTTRAPDLRLPGSRTVRNTSLCLSHPAHGVCHCPGHWYRGGDRKDRETGGGRCPGRTVLLNPAPRSEDFQRLKRAQRDLGGGFSWDLGLRHRYKCLKDTSALPRAWCSWVPE